MSGTITGTRAGTTSKRVCCSEHEGRKAGEHETGRLECVWTGTVSLRALSCHGIQAEKITDSMTMSCVSFYQGDGSRVTGSREPSTNLQLTPTAGKPPTALHT